MFILSVRSRNMIKIKKTEEKEHFLFFKQKEITKVRGLCVIRLHYAFKKSKIFKKLRTTGIFFNLMFLFV